MAKSNARKQREKLAREGKRNPELNRSLFAFADMRQRSTKTKAEKVNQRKHKRPLSCQSDDGFFIAFFLPARFPAGTGSRSTCRSGACHSSVHGEACFAGTGFFQLDGTGFTGLLGEGFVFWTDRVVGIGGIAYARRTAISRKEACANE